ncbi:hypothetical protein QOZ80_2BG0181170 [Eleusine coracana subsp. coracana]|nr:hypothetical protein QOZ80_2BG0181170 [Eleusine coracana subsp. coracana]
MDLVRRRPRVLAEIDPHSEWVRGSEFDTLVVDVTGFTKDHLKVLVEPSGSLKVSGERAVEGGGGRQCYHFLKRFDLPAGVDAAAIKVQLDKGMLYIQVPRPGTESGEEQCTPAEIHEVGDDIGGGGWVVARQDEHLVGRLARGLSKHRQVVLNVVLAVVLLWLVAFVKDKPSGGHVHKNY